MSKILDFLMLILEKSFINIVFYTFVVLFFIVFFITAPIHLPFYIRQVIREFKEAKRKKVLEHAEKWNGVFGD